MRRCLSNADRGSATVLVLFVVGLTVVLTAAVAQLGVLVAARSQAATAADAAALAAAVATYPSASSARPAGAAAQAASLNRARLDSCTCRLDSSLGARVVHVITVVPVDLPLFGRLDVRASARAEFDPRAWLGR